MREDCFFAGTRDQFMPASDMIGKDQDARSVVVSKSKYFRAFRKILAKYAIRGHSCCNFIVWGVLGC